MRVAAGMAAIAIAGFAAPAVGAEGSAATDSAATAEQNAALARAQMRWQRAGLRDYRFRLRVSCFCVNRGGARTVVVRDGRPHGAGTVGRLVDTVPEMFVLIRRTLADSKAGDVRVRYDTRLGVPLNVSLDRIRIAADDELYWTVDRLRAP